MCLLCASVCYLCVSIDLPFAVVGDSIGLAAVAIAIAISRLLILLVLLLLLQMLWLLLFVRSISKRHSILLRAEAQLKFYAHLHLQYMAHA